MIDSVNDGKNWPQKWIFILFYNVSSQTSGECREPERIKFMIFEIGFMTFPTVCALEL